MPHERLYHHHLPVTQLASCFSQVDEWLFDAFKLSEASDGRPLSCLAFYLFKKMELVSKFRLEEAKLAKYDAHCRLQRIP